MQATTTKSALGDATNTEFFKLKFVNSKLLILLFVGFFSFTINAQISYDGYSQENIQKLSQIDNHINALRVKRDHVKSDPEENSLAEQAGWFDENRKFLWQLFAKKRLIIREETNKEFFSIEEFAELSPEKQQIVIDANQSIIEQ